MTKSNAYDSDRNKKEKYCTFLIIKEIAWEEGGCKIDKSLSTRFISISISIHKVTA